MFQPYTDDNCRYLGGDPRLDESGDAEVEVRDDGIRIQLANSEVVLVIPKSAIETVQATTQWLGMEQAEYEEGVIIGPDESLLRHVAVIVARDPEGIYPGGFNIRLSFRNEYVSKLFEKRCSEAFSLLPF